MENKRIKIANIVRKTARYSLLFLGSIVFIFALLSGSEQYGGGFYGVVRNSPNALPWLTLLLFLFIAWKRELIGGLIISVLGVFLLYFFNFTGNNFFFVTFLITIIIILQGVLFLISWYLRK